MNAPLPYDAALELQLNNHRSLYDTFNRFVCCGMPSANACRKSEVESSLFNVCAKLIICQTDLTPERKSIRIDDKYRAMETYE